MLEIMQATTPTLMFRLAFEVDLELLNIVFTLTQGTIISIEKHNEDMRYEDGLLQIDLTQEDTIKLKPGTAKIQLNITANDGSQRAGTYEEDVKILNNQVKRILR